MAGAAEHQRGMAPDGHAAGTPLVPGNAMPMNPRVACRGLSPPRSAAVPLQPIPFTGLAQEGKARDGGRGHGEIRRQSSEPKTRNGIEARPREPNGPLGTPGNRMCYCQGLLIDTELIQPNVRLSTYMHRRLVWSTITAAVNRHPSNTD